MAFFIDIPTADGKGGFLIPVGADPEIIEAARRLAAGAWPSPPIPPDAYADEPLIHCPPPADVPTVVGPGR